MKWRLLGRGSPLSNIVSDGPAVRMLHPFIDLPANTDKPGS